MVPAPVGFQCVDCVRNTRSRVTPGRVLIQGKEPYLSYALIGVNTAVWMIGLAIAAIGGSTANFTSGNALAAMGGLYGPAVAAGEWWRIITAAFLHSGLIHLGFNMVALAMVAPPLERALGRTRFGVLFLAALVAGSFGALVASPGSLTVGASGAIYGLFGAILVGQRAAGMSIRSSGIIAILVINLVFTFAVPGISIGGHLGGLAGGLIAGAILFNRRLTAQNPILPVAACLALAGVLFWASIWVAGHPILH
jgi:membrane associated rhomboid family serine protease